MNIIVADAKITKALNNIIEVTIEGDSDYSDNPKHNGKRGETTTILEQVPSLSDTTDLNIFPLAPTATPIPPDTDTVIPTPTPVLTHTPDHPVSPGNLSELISRIPEISPDRISVSITG